MKMGDSQLEENMDNNESETLIQSSSRKTSAVWKLFTDLGNDLAMCNLCKRNFSHKTISNLRKHLACRHSIVSPSEKGSNEPLKIKRKYDEFVQEVKVDKTPRKKSSDYSIQTIEIMTPNLDHHYYFPKKTKSTPEEERSSMDEYIALGITVAAKLKKMDEMQRLFCERLINAAMFKAAVRQLSPASDIVPLQIKIKNDAFLQEVKEDETTRNKSSGFRKQSIEKTTQSFDHPYFCQKKTKPISEEHGSMDEYIALGITVASKLKKIDERQRLFCERLINTALFKAAIHQLSPASEIVNIVVNPPGHQ